MIVAAVAVSAPLLLGLAPALRLPAVVLELVAGIAIGPSGFGWVELDEPIRVRSLIGLAFLLFPAGLSVLAFPLLSLTLPRRGQSRAETRITAAPHPTTP